VVGVIGSLEKHVERQQSENEKREAAASAASVNEEELNVEESSEGGDDLVQPNNDVTGDDGNVSPGLAATAIPTSEVVGGKKRSREAESSSRRSNKRVKLPHSKVHATSEEAGTSSQTPVLRKSVRRATTKAHARTFEGTSTGIEEEEADDNCMPSREEDGSPLDDGDDDHHAEDREKGIVAKRAQQGRAANKSFDQHFKDLMDFKDNFGHTNVPKSKPGKYQPLGDWCNNVRMSYKKIQARETPHFKLTEEHIRQLEDAGFKWSLSAYSTFDERYAELMRYKEKFRHCNVPRSKSGEYQSLGSWCDNLRSSYKKIQKRQTPHTKLTEDHIRQLEDADFIWSLRQST